MTIRVKRCVVLALLACGAAYAEGIIYKCVSPQGRTEYTDVDRGNDCKAMDLPGTVVPAPPRRQGTARAGSISAAVSTPLDFPRVDSAEQRARDADRRD